MKVREMLKWVWEHCKTSWWMVALSCFVGVCNVVVTLCLVWSSKLLIDTATSTDEPLSGLIAVFVGIITAQIVLSIVRSKLNSYNSVVLANHLRYRLFEVVMLSRWSGREKFHTGDVMNRLEGDVSSITNVVCRLLPEVFVTGTQMILAFVLLYHFEPRMAWLALVVMPVALIVSKRYFVVMRKLTNTIRARESELQAFTQEKIQHRTLYMAIENVDRTVNQLGDLQSQLFKEEMSRTNYSLFSNTMVRVGFTVTYIVVFAWGILGLREGAITYGLMAAFLQLVSQIQGPIVSLSRHVSTIAQVLTSIERLGQLTQLAGETLTAKIEMGERLGVRINDLCYSYDDAPDKEVLSGLTYDFAPNKFHVIVGHSGVGKSTLVRIVMALLTPKSGSVTLYDDDRECVSSPQTRNNITYVPQGNTLLSGSVLSNLKLGNPEASDEQIEQAIYTAAAQFIYDLPDSLQTVVGEGGAGLSEGQAQRIAIARALLRPSSLVILDEPTAALDGATEQLLMERLRSYAKHRTLIMVTHRPSAVSDCDSVLNLCND